MDIQIGVSTARQDALQHAGQPIPQPVQIRGLIDTGAGCTCVDPDVLRQLNLNVPTSTVPMLTPSTGNVPQQMNQFDVSLVLLHPRLNLTFFNVAVVESQLAVQGIQALIGRDILSTCLFVYDGQTGTFSLAF